MTKTCAKCSIEKPITDFAINRPKTGGRHSYCRPCRLAYAKAHDAVNAESIAAKRKADRLANPAKYSARSRAYYEANAGAIAAKNKARYDADPEPKRARNRERLAQVRQSRTPEQRAALASARLVRHYGITLDDYSRMLADQGGLCGNPGCFAVPPADRRFDVDHDHGCCPGDKSCGRCVRGLLCPTCNRAMGQLADDPKRIQGLADYLEASRHR